MAEARARANAEHREAEQRRHAEQVKEARRARLKALKQRGAWVWREIEEEIERRNAAGYDKAAGLVSDLQALAAEEGSQVDFGHRLAALRARHQRKAKFIERLNELGLEHGQRSA